MKRTDGRYKCPTGSRERTKTLTGTNADSNGGDIAMHSGLKWSQNGSVVCVQSQAILEITSS